MFGPLLFVLFVLLLHFMITFHMSSDPHQVNWNINQIDRQIIKHVEIKNEDVQSLQN